MTAFLIPYLSIIYDKQHRDVLDAQEVTKKSAHNWTQILLRL